MKKTLHFEFTFVFLRNELDFELREMLQQSRP